MTPVELILIGLVGHIGRKAIDWVWDNIQSGKAPVVNKTNNVGFTGSHEGRTLVEREFTSFEPQNQELVIGRLFLPHTILNVLSGDEIPLVLIIEEEEQQVVFFTADLIEGFEIYLPHAIYSIYVFLMDSSADNFQEAEIYAIGFPSSVDLSSVTEFSLEDIVYDAPIGIISGGSNILDIILVDTDQVPEFPRYFSELFES